MTKNGQKFMHRVRSGMQISMPPVVGITWLHLAIHREESPSQLCPRHSSSDPLFFIAGRTSVTMQSLRYAGTTTPSMSLV